eukprot:TRINITY_DN10343_c0_g1_i1.p1 TRINITY_DN10343_c0_g1~~TRINITY_DN10343_c0_g1_i1.p1  ORF type:complete len:424 (-),score=63.98 TRINITY_DN10343_c0_g1_i1:296-1567(-)
MSSGQTLGVKAQRFRGHTSPHRNVKAGGAAGHFGYYAFEGGSGEERWRHEGRDFHRDLEDLQEELVPQHNFRIDAQSVESRHYGEASCRDYRESVLRALPHVWTKPSDTNLLLAHFHKHAANQHHKRAKSFDNAVSHTMGKLAESATQGGSISKKVDTTPNVVLGYLEDGIQAIHLYTGRVICGLQLRSGGIHVDLNGDGVVDHIYGESCSAFGYSGIPERHHFFNGSICRTGFEVMSKHRQWAADSADKVQLAAPAFLPNKHFKNRLGYVIFLNSRGELTAFDHNGLRKWQSGVGASWGEDDSQVVTTLKAIRLNNDGGVPNAILAAAASTLTVVSQNGNKLFSIQLPAPPTSPILTYDFSRDGYKDLIITTNNNIFAYEQVRRPSGLPFSTIVGCLIIAMVGVYFTSHQNNTQHIKIRGIS